MSKPGTKVQKQAMRDRKAYNQALRDRTTALMEKVVSLEKIARSSKQTGLIPPNLMDQTRALDGKLMKCLESINILSKKKNPEARAVLIKSIETELTALEKEFATLPKYEDINRNLTQKEFSALLQLIENKVAAFKKTEKPADKALAAEWTLLQSHCNRWEAQKAAAVAQDYTIGIETLSVYDKNLNELNGRLVVLQKYNEAVQQLDHLVQSGKDSVRFAKDMMDSVQVESMKYYVGLANLNTLSAKIDSISKELVVLSKKDYMLDAKGKNTSQQGVIAIAVKNCTDETTRLAKLLKDFDSSFIDFKRQITSSLKLNLLAIERNIKEHSKRITSICDSLEKALRDEGLATAIVETYRSRLLKAMDKSNTIRQDPIELANKQLQAVMTLFDELGAEQSKQKLLIKASIQQKTQEFEAIVTTSTKFLAENDRGRYQLSSSEKELVEGIRSYQHAAEAGKGDHKKLVAMKASLIHDIGAVKTVLDRHRLALEFVNNKVVDVTRLITEQLNQGKSELLDIIPLYCSKKEFIDLLGNHLDLLDNKGIDALRSYIGKHGSSDFASIEPRLDFIEMALIRDIPNYKELLKDTNVLRVVTILSKNQLQDHITQNNLLNKAFCNALLKLEELNILTPQNINALVKDNNKCAFVDRIKDNNLIQQFLNANSEVVSEFNDLSKKAHPDNHSLLLNILLNKTNLVANKAFLTAILTPLLRDQEQSLMMSLKDKNQKKGSDLEAMGKMMEAINTYIQTTKTQLEKQIAELDKPETKLTDDVVTQLKEKREALAGLSNFHRGVIPILLNNSSLAEKKEALMNCADDHLKGTGLWAAIKAFIGRLCDTVSEKYFTKENVGVKNLINENTAHITVAYKKGLEEKNPKQTGDDPNSKPVI